MPLRASSAPPSRASDPRRAAVVAILRPFADGVLPGGTGTGLLTERRIAERTRDAAQALRRVLGSPWRSPARIRTLIAPLLTCPWAALEAEYAAALDALLALPPAIPGVTEPAWDAHLRTPVATRSERLTVSGAGWTVPLTNEQAVGPGGTVGRVARRDVDQVLLTGDGRPVRQHARCACAPAHRRQRAAVPYEIVHLGRDHAVVAVTTGAACGACRACRPADD